MELKKIKTALITGASKGIGYACARQLSKEGWHIIVNYKSDHKAAKILLEKIQAEGGSCEIYQTDLSIYKEIKTMFDYIKKTFNNFQVLINNAGTAPIISMKDIDENEWDNLLNTNLKAPFFCAKKAIEIMRLNQFGRIINIGSQAGFTGGYYSGIHYAVSKGGIHTLTKRLAKECAGDNILVNCISPGLIETEGVLEYPLEIRKKIINQIPLGKIGTPQDVANAVSFLVSNKANYLTGINLSVSGGLLMN